MRFRLRTLLIVLALAPVVLWFACPPLIRSWNKWQRKRAVDGEIEAIIAEAVKNVELQKALQQRLDQKASPLP